MDQLELLKDPPINEKYTGTISENLGDVKDFHVAHVRIRKLRKRYPKATLDVTYRHRQYGYLWETNLCMPPRTGYWTPQGTLSSSTPLRKIKR